MQIHINDDAKKDGLTCFISWNNPFLQEAISESVWLKNGEQVTDLFIDQDGITAKIEKIVIQPMRRES